MTPDENNNQIAVVAGTRPEIVKLAPIVRLLGSNAFLIHTRQHEDEELSGVFLAAAGISHARALSGICRQPRHVQMSRMIEQLGELLGQLRPAAVIVQGDTNTASAGAQAASYAGVPVIHVEAGLRSFDRAMPEEINRCVTGVLADLHCAPTPQAAANLRAEGVPAARIAVTGNTIVEATMQMRPAPQEARQIAASLGAEPDGYVLATIHRPENTDDPSRLEVILSELAKIGLPVLLPLHPRTRAAARRHGLAAALDRLQVIPPADHRTFLGLASLARLLVSDSGGVQEECTVLKRPLIVVRNSTERPESIAAGFAHLVTPGPAIGDLGRMLIADRGLGARLAAIPCPFGDGRASERIAGLARQFLA
ncbi:MAG TPA: UDP-N-acetylglucosamine 2-epimerase (non-hydrolyzing) [Streptosporangiaceae bacterium]|jgi:UDP-N-acetylglucosamine 2-epimerase (non-hydrolysing)